MTSHGRPTESLAEYREIDNRRSTAWTVGSMAFADDGGQEDCAAHTFSGFEEAVVEISAIGPVGSTPYVYPTVGIQRAQPAPPPTQPNQVEPTRDVDQALRTAGVDDETRLAVESELSTALQAIASPSAPLEPQKVEETIRTVLETHGLEVDSILQKPRLRGPEGYSGPPPGNFGPGPGRGGPPSNVDSDETETSNSTKSYLDILIEMLDDSTNSSSETSSPSSDSTLFTDILFGIDVRA